MSESCKTCRFWDHEAKCAVDDDDDSYSWCQRYPPVLAREPVSTIDEEAWQQPFTSHVTWCGEYREMDSPPDYIRLESAINGVEDSLGDVRSAIIHN